MKTTLLLAVASTCLSSSVQALTALEALREIPAADRPMLAIIDGHEGAPEPQRWHFLFYDANTENGLREFVVDSGQVVANREISQFAESLRPDQAIGALGIKVDSDTVTRTAYRFAAANQREIVSMDFALRKDEFDGVPIWTVVCRDDRSRAFASLVVTGSDGRVLSHEGFPIVPPRAEPRRIVKAAPSPAIKAPRSQVAQTRRAPQPEDEYLPPVYDGPRDYRDEDGVRVRRAEPVRRERPLPNPVDDVIRPLHRIVRSLLPF